MKLTARLKDAHQTGCKRSNEKFYQSIHTIDEVAEAIALEQPLKKVSPLGLIYTAFFTGPIEYIKGFYSRLKST